MLKNSGNIEWVGAVRGNEKTGFLGNAQFLVVPSRFEGQGIVVLEEAACGKAVIVSDIPELSYAVDAGFGISFKTGEAGDLAEKMKLLVGNEALRKGMGQRGIEFARRFTWDIITEEYELFLLGMGEKNRKGNG
jgi:glycosyltransferase involved in cell wall biosynthesis